MFYLFQRTKLKTYRLHHTGTLPDIMTLLEERLGIRRYKLVQFNELKERQGYLIVRALGSDVISSIL